VEQPKGYEQKEGGHKVYKLHKALYGLKQAPQGSRSALVSKPCLSNKSVEVNLNCKCLCQ
jgi:hypothetical protein